MKSIICIFYLSYLPMYENILGWLQIFSYRFEGWVYLNSCEATLPNSRYMHSLSFRHTLAPLAIPKLKIHVKKHLHLDSNPQPCSKLLLSVHHSSVAQVNSAVGTMRCYINLTKVSFSTEKILNLLKHSWYWGLYIYCVNMWMRMHVLCARCEISGLINMTVVLLPYLHKQAEKQVVPWSPPNIQKQF